MHIDLSGLNSLLVTFYTKFRWILLIITFMSLAWVCKKNVQFMIDQLHSLGILAPLGFVLLYCLLSIFCLPNVILILAGGVLFGPFVGTVINLVGATLGAICGFGISRYFRFNEGVLMQNKRVQRLITRVERQGWKSVALLRLTPLAPYNLVNYGLGLTRIKFMPFLLATVIFLIPSKILVTCCGYYGVSVLDLLHLK